MYFCCRLPIEELLPDSINLEVQWIFTANQHQAKYTKNGNFSTWSKLLTIDHPSQIRQLIKKINLRFRPCQHASYVTDQQVYNWAIQNNDLYQTRLHHYPCIYLKLSWHNVAYQPHQTSCEIGHNYQNLLSEGEIVQPLATRTKATWISG